MSEKKSIWAALFGGKSGVCCDTEVNEKSPKKKKAGGCCDIKIMAESMERTDDEDIKGGEK